MKEALDRHIKAQVARLREATERLESHSGQNWDALLDEAVFVQQLGYGLQKLTEARKRLGLEEAKTA